MAQGVALVETAAAVLPQKLRGEIGSAFHPSVFAVPKMEGIVDWIAATREALDLVGRKANCVCKYYPVPLRQLRPAAAFTRAFSTFWPQMLPMMLQKDVNTLLSLYLGGFGPLAPSSAVLFIRDQAGQSWLQSWLWLWGWQLCRSKHEDLHGLLCDQRCCLLRHWREFLRRRLFLVLFGRG